MKKLKRKLKKHKATVSELIERLNSAALENELKDIEIARLNYLIKKYSISN